MSLPVFAPGISALGMGSLYFMPTLATPSTGVAVAEITAGVDISCAIDAFTANAEQGVFSKTRYCSKQETQIPGKVTWSGDPLVYVWDPQNPDDATNYKHVTTLADGVSGYLGNRLGLDAQTVAPTAAQILALVIPVTLGVQVPVPIDPTQEGQEFQLSQAFFITGPVYKNVPITA